MTDEEIKTAAIAAGCWAIPGAPHGLSANHNAGVLELVRGAIESERDRCASFCWNCPEVEAKIRSGKFAATGTKQEPKQKPKPMTMDEIAQEIQRGNTYLGKVWLCSEPIPAPTSDRLMLLLAHAVKEADGWFDESRGGQIDDDPLMDEARALVAGMVPAPTLERK